MTLSSLFPLLSVLTEFHTGILLCADFRDDGVGTSSRIRRFEQSQRRFRRRRPLLRRTFFPYSAAAAPSAQPSFSADAQAERPALPGQRFNLIQFRKNVPFFRLTCSPQNSRRDVKYVSRSQLGKRRQTAKSFCFAAPSQFSPFLHKGHGKEQTADSQR